MIAALRLSLAGQTPPPAPLPSLATALSRRRAIFGAVLAPMALTGSAARAVGVSKFGETADVRLTVLGAEVDRTLDGAAYAQAPVHDDADQNRRLDHAESLLITMSDIPAAGPMGILAKAKAWLDSDSYDVQEGGALAESLCNDIERLHKVGGLV